MREKLVYAVLVAFILCLMGLGYFFQNPTNKTSSKPKEASEQKQPPLIRDESYVTTELNGETLSKYSVDWWTWLYSIPRNKISPVIDRDGSSCGFNQKGDVWFLAGSAGDDHQYVRDCTVPRGKHIFFPVLTMVSITNPVCYSAQIDADIEQDKLLKIEVVLDNKILPDPKKFKAKSPGCFRLKGYVSGMYDGLGVYPVASDGYWILIKPPEPGPHILRFKAEYILHNKNEQEENQEQENTFVQNIQYNLLIQ